MSAGRTVTACVRRCVVCQDGGYLVQVAITKPKQIAAVRSSEPLPEGRLITLRGDGRAWSIAA